MYGVSIKTIKDQLIVGFVTYHESTVQATALVLYDRCHLYSKAPYMQTHHARCKYILFSNLPLGKVAQTPIFFGFRQLVSVMWTLWPLFANLIRGHLYVEYPFNPFLRQVSGHPRNSIRHGRWYATVERLESEDDDAWLTVFTDADWETKYVFTATVCIYILIYLY